MVRSLSRSLVDKCWHFWVITLFRSALFYLSYMILNNICIEPITPLYSKHSLTYKLIMNYSGWTNLSAKVVNLYSLKPTTGAYHSLKGPPPLIMTDLGNFRSSTSMAGGYLYKIISYLLLEDSSTWHFHITIFFAPNSGKHNSTFTSFEGVNFLTLVSYVVVTAYFCLSFDFILPIRFLEPLPFFSRIRKFLNFYFPLQVFIQDYNINK